MSPIFCGIKLSSAFGGIRCIICACNTDIMTIKLEKRYLGQRKTKRERERVAAKAILASDDDDDDGVGCDDGADFETLTAIGRNDGSSSDSSTTLRKTDERFRLRDPPRSLALELG